MLKVLSLGAGVQSSTLALMMVKGEIEKADCAIFADTGAEPKKVYEWLDWLETHLTFPLYRVQTGEGIVKGLEQALNQQRFASVPFFTESDSKTGKGQLRRQCTREYKIDPILKKVRELIGLGWHRRAAYKLQVIQYIGISTDEASRMKPSQQYYIQHQYPLINLGMSRQDCLDWMLKNGYPKPAKSACIFCPYHDDALWLDMKQNDPESWNEAVKMDEKIRSGIRGTTRKLYLHQTLKPLAEVEFKPREKLSSFIEECEGMCGV